MGTLDNPKTWIPYMNSKECAKQICTLSCPQWCYLIFPPPPPLAFPNDKSQNNIAFSPLVIAIIGSLASAFLLVSYYAIISKYCGRSSRRVRNQSPNEETEEDGNYYDNNHVNELSQHEPWFISTNGLDEALIKNITLVKYKIRDGLIGSRECSVCLGEFEEDDNLRLLPKCSHAFHVACIDTWLRSHSNCPLCRANIVSIFAQPLHPPPILVVDEANDSHNQARDHESLSENHVTNDETRTSRDGSGRLLTRHFRTYSDLPGLALRESNNNRGNDLVMRRSISMDHLHETSVSISSMVKLIHGKDCQAENWQIDEQPVKMAVGENNMSGFGNCSTSSNCRDGVNSAAFKRSFSSCRFLFSKHGRGSSETIPL